MLFTKKKKKSLITYSTNNKLRPMAPSARSHILCEHPNLTKKKKMFKVVNEQCTCGRVNESQK